MRSNSISASTISFTKSAALEVAGKGVRVNAVCPGPVDTRMMTSIESGRAPDDPAAFRVQREAAIPDGRYATPQEIANLMMYLASDLSSHITAQGVQINGGVNS